MHLYLKKTSYFINVDGIDLSGKSTHINYIGKWMDDNKINYIITRGWEDTDLGVKLKSIILHPSCKLTLGAGILMFYADRVQNLAENILPALEDGKCVITERFLPATYAYHACGLGIDLYRINALNDWIASPRPTINIILDIPFELFLKRKKAKMSSDKYEKLDIDFLKRVHDYYRGLKGQYQCEFIDSSQDIEIVQSNISKILEKVIDI